MAVFIIILTLIYFPLLPNISFGGFEATITSVLILLLAGTVLLKMRRMTVIPKITVWQKTLLFFLTLSFILASIFTISMRITLGALPNMGLYILELLAIPLLVDSKRKLVTIAKAIMVLAFVLSFWKVELRPFRNFLDLSGLGGLNGFVFNFHPAVAIALVVLLVQPSWFSRRWKFFSALTLISLVLHGIQFETRAAWLAWIIILTMIISRLPARRFVKLIFLILPIITLLLWPYFSLLIHNLDQTKITVISLFSENSTYISRGDLIREVGLRAGLAMFRERPLLGQGPGLYASLLGEFSPGRANALMLGAFNAWLIVLAELGIVGIIAILALVLTPFWISWRLLRKEQNDYKWLVFAFALGVVALSIHLLFISQMYSFFWVHLGLALAGGRLAIAEVDEQTPIPPLSKEIREYLKNPLRFKL